VLYDSLADRWLISQFTAAAPYNECIAISSTGDPTGTWNRYAFTLSMDAFPDYPHLAVWPDGYYMSVNWFLNEATYMGPRPYVFDRARMLAGQVATFQTTDPLGPAVEPLLPSDLDGNAAPPPGEPNIFLSASNPLQLYQFHVDWTTPANSTWANTAHLIPAAFSPICGTNPNCLPQPRSGQRLDAVDDRVMHRLAYRNFGDHEALIATHTVDVGNSLAGIRWYEIRDPAGSPTIFQQGSYAPDDDHRWLPSAAQDQDGNLAIGYNVTSWTTYPSIRIAGRLAADPLGTLAQGETRLLEGTASQPRSPHWGDYNSMSVDPMDGCTFWYTSAYIDAATGAWKTLITTFRFAACRGLPPPTVTGTPPTATPTVTGTPPTATATRTAVPRPTDTATPTATGSPTPTRTITPTGTITPTPSRTATRTRTATPTATVCANLTTVLTEDFAGGLGTFTSRTTTCTPGGCGWTPTTALAHSGGVAAFVPDVAGLSDQRLVLETPVLIPGDAVVATLRFWHAYQFEPTEDGGILEASTDGGTTWQDAGANITSGRYSGIVSGSWDNPLGRRAGWVARSPGYPAFSEVAVNLLPYAGQLLLIRFRDGTNQYVGAEGWAVDDVTITVGSACAPAASPTATRPSPTDTARPTATRPAPPTRTPSPPCDQPASHRFLMVYSDSRIPPTNLRTQLRHLDGVGTVELFNAQTASPTLAELQAYDTVVVFSDSGFDDPVGLGTTLARYADWGGVIVAFNFDWYGVDRSLKGDWLTEGYTPFDNPGKVNFGPGSLATPIPDHPLLTGVSTLTSQRRETLTVAAGATRVADWDDGSPLLATKGQVVGVSAYVGDQLGGWSGDYAQLILNAANWLGQVPCATPTTARAAPDPDPSRGGRVGAEPPDRS
jgi:hypothetical protein